jgi:hypothetical protein
VESIAVIRRKGRLWSAITAKFTQRKVIPENNTTTTPATASHRDGPFFTTKETK